MKLREQPQEIVEGWAMDLYCRYIVDYRHDADTWGVSIGGPSKHEAHKEARRLGWRLHRDGTATCPRCMKAIKALKCG